MRRLYGKYAVNKRLTAAGKASILKKYRMRQIGRKERPVTIEEMKARKTELGLTSSMISEASGVPLGTVQKIFGGITKAPRKMTIEAIERVLRRETDNRDGVYPETHPVSAMTVRDSAGLYNTASKEKRYTIEDYYALPEDQRVELIDGIFYDMGAPAMLHQRILGDLHILFRECADRHGMPCEVYLSPCDVRLDEDDYTMVQPDLLVICHEYDYHAIRYEGAPDLVVEILSPSSRMKDMILKLHKYQNAGVREYWIVDPEHHTVTVHLFDTEEYDPVKYTFREEIPVGISGGSCSIDFSKVRA